MAKASVSPDALAFCFAQSQPFHTTWKLESGKSDTDIPVCSNRSTRPDGPLTLPNHHRNGDEKSPDHGARVT